MKIKILDIEVKNIPLKTPFATALRRVESVSFVRMTLICDNGFQAIGEAPATKAITGEGLEDIVHSIQTIKEKILHQNLQDALKFLHESKIGSSAKACVDMALISLCAQERNQDIAQYLGCTKKSILQTDITVSLGNIDFMIKKSIELYDSGMDILKVKLGSDIHHAVNVTHGISKSLPNATLLIDANQAWTLEDTLFFIEAMKGFNIALIEQPVIAKDLDALREITQKSHIPILADESVFTLEDVKKVVESNAAHMINIKLMKCGGLTKAVEILEYARKKQLKCMLGSMLEGPFSINASLHLAQAYTDVISYIDLDSPLLYKHRSDELEYIFENSFIVAKN